VGALWEVPLLHSRGLLKQMPAPLYLLRLVE